MCTVTGIASRTPAASVITSYSIHYTKLYDRGQPIINLIRQPEFVEYLQNGKFARPLTLRSDRAEERVLSIYVLPFAGSQRLMQVKDVTQTDRLDRMRRDFVANVSHESYNFV